MPLKRFSFSPQSFVDVEGELSGTHRLLGDLLRRGSFAHDCVMQCSLNEHLHGFLRSHVSDKYLGTSGQARPLPSKLDQRRMNHASTCADEKPWFKFGNSLQTLEPNVK